MPNPRIQTVARALPSHFASQDELIDAFKSVWAQEHFNLERLEQLHRSVQVSGRHLTGRENPAGPSCRASQTSPIPPSAIRRTRR